MPHTPSKPIHFGLSQGGMGYKGVDCTLVATAELISRGPLARIQTIIFAGDEKKDTLFKLQ